MDILKKHELKHTVHYASTHYIQISSFCIENKPGRIKKAMTGKRERTIKHQNISLIEAFLKNLPECFTARKLHVSVFLII